MVVYIFLFIVGCIMGSFLTCQGERIATKRDWIRGRSVCDNCGETLKGRDLIPVLSYLATGGRCRYCNNKISQTAILGELFCGYMYVRLFLVYGFSLTYIEIIFLVSALYSLSIVDYKTMIIPDGFIIFGCLNRFIFEFIMNGFTKNLIVRDLIGGFLVAGILLIASLIMDKILKRESLGGGDVKLFFINRRCNISAR